MYGWIIVSVAVVLIIAVIMMISKNIEESSDSARTQILDLGGLTEETRRIINDVTLLDYSEFNLPDKEYRARLSQQRRIQKAIRDAAVGDTADREYLKDEIKTILQTQLGVTKQNISRIIPFSYPDRMSARDKFEFLYASYFKVYATQSLGHMIEDFGWDREIPDGDFFRYEITEEDVSKAFELTELDANYNDELNTVVERIYATLYGHDAADILTNDKSLDGVSCGVGGKTRLNYNYYEDIFREGGAELRDPAYYDMLWIVYRGRMIRMKFLTFGSEASIMRVVNSIYKYNPQEQLSAKYPALQSEMKTGERLMVLRPKVYGGYAFLLRNYTAAGHLVLDELFTDKGAGIVKEIFRDVFGSMMNICISGPPEAGKTTDLKAGIGHMDPRARKRVAEAVFEADLNNIYPEQNIVCLQETPGNDIDRLLAISKRLDTDVFIVAETNMPEIVEAIVSVSRSGSKCVMTTIHTNDTWKLLAYMREAIMRTGNYDRRTADEIAVDVFDLDIHQVKDASGHHYIEYISEISPYTYPEYSEDVPCATIEYYDRTTNFKAAAVREIVRFDTDIMQYCVKEDFSERFYTKMAARNPMAAKRLREYMTEALAGGGYAV